MLLGLQNTMQITTGLKRGRLQKGDDDYLVSGELISI
jgi:hypothetical protein